jgi:hypothetical protein
MEEESNLILDRIITWLREEEIQETKIDNKIRITFWYNQVFKIEVAVNNDKLTILTELRFEDDIRNLHSSNKNYFHELDLSLHQQNKNYLFTPYLTLVYN